MPLLYFRYYIGSFKKSNPICDLELLTAFFMSRDDLLKRHKICIT